MDTLVTITTIVRHSPPTELDQLQQGTFCKVIYNNGEIELYEQKNADSNTPDWQLINSKLS